MRVLNQGREDMRFRPRNRVGEYKKPGVVARVKAWFGRLVRFTVKWTLITGGAAILMGIGFEFGGNRTDVILPAAAATQIIDRTPEKIEALKVSVIQKLSD